MIREYFVSPKWDIYAYKLNLLQYNSEYYNLVLNAKLVEAVTN